MAQPRSRFPAYPPDLPEGLQLYLEAIRKEISTLGVSGGASIRIEESDAVVSTAANVIDFFGTDFDVTQSPVGEANIAISSAIARTGHTHDAADVTTGIFSRARLPSQLAYEDEPNTFTLTQTFSVQLVSSVTTGTAPFSVASTTVVTNLNADFLDGQTGTFYTDLANATGNLAYARLPTGGGTWANGGTLSITGGVTTVAGLTSSADITAQARLLLTTAASKIVPGATSLALRNTADSADNAIWTNAGDATFRTKLTMPGPLVLTTAASTIVPGATSLALRNTADNANNLLVTDAGISTFRNDVVMDVLGTYDHTGTRFTTGTGPVADDVLSYHGGAGKWRPRFLQAAFTSGVAVSQSNTDGTFATFFNSNPTLSGTPTAPTNAPVTTAMYKAILIDMSAYSLGGTQAYVLDYSINGGGYTTNKIISTSTKVIHSGLDPANTYAYKYKIRGGSDSTYSPASSALNPSSATEANAFGLIVASQIATAYISSINANIGSITAGQLISGDGKSILQLDSTFSVPGTVTQGIFFASANPVPGGVTGMYIDFTATSTNPILHHTKLSLLADGTAIFGGLIDISGAPFAAAIGGAYIVTRDPDVAHGMTDLVPTDVNGLLWILSGTDGGLGVAGFSDSTNGALGFGAYNVGASTTSPVMIFEAGKKSGTTAVGLASTDLAFAFVSRSASPNLLNIFGNGDLVTPGTLTFSTAASKIIPGATSLSLRNNANSVDNVLVVDAGDVTVAGSLTAAGGVIGVKLRSSNVTSVGTGAATAETDLMTHTLPTLANGDKVDVFAQGLVTGTSNTKTIRVKVGGTTYGTIVCPSGTTGDYYFHLQLVKDGATTRHVVATSTDTLGITSNIFGGSIGVDLSGAIVKTTGQTPNAADEVTTEAMTIMIYKA